jgi:branched-chain amino acid transport system substrate-binding protein
MNRLAGFGFAVAALVSTGAAAQDKVKVGLIVTLSGPSAVLGQQARNGLEMAFKDLGGKVGGKDVELIVVDDELKPDVAVTKVRGLLERDKVDFVVGPIFSNVLGAIAKPVTDAQTFLISPNAGSSALAGKACSPFFFATSYQIAVTRRSTCSPRTIRPARTRWPGSSETSKGRSWRNLTSR